MGVNDAQSGYGFRVGHWGVGADGDACGSARAGGAARRLRPERPRPWDPTGGCTLKKGDVTLEEFNDLLTSPLSLATIGHPAWRNAPTYLKIKPDKTVNVTNRGGRLHTFTEVAAFGGGRVPPLNVGLTPAPECVTPDIVGPTELPPGARLKVDGLDVGNHLFQCCIHPWMRTLIKVKGPEEE
jgi:hypothetical protein